MARGRKNKRRRGSRERKGERRWDLWRDQGRGTGFRRTAQAGEDQGDGAPPSRMVARRPPSIAIVLAICNLSSQHHPHRPQKRVHLRLNHAYLPTILANRTHLRHYSPRRCTDSREVHCHPNRGFHDETSYNARKLNHTPPNQVHCVLTYILPANTRSPGCPSVAHTEHHTKGSNSAKWY